MRRSSAASWSAPTGAFAMSCSSLLSAADKCTQHPVRDELAVLFRGAAERLRRRLEIAGGLAVGRERGGVLRGQRVLRGEARLHRLRQLGQFGAHALDPRVVDRERRQVGIGKVAVVLRVFLAAHRPRFAAVGVVEARLLDDGAAFADQLDLAPHLEFDRLLHEAEAVEVLDLAARAELRFAGRAHRDVGVAAEAALLHVAVADADPLDQRVQRLGIGHGLGGAAHVGLGDDLEQRRPGAVEVDARSCRGNPRAGSCRRLPRGARG